MPAPSPLHVERVRPAASWPMTQELGTGRWLPVGPVRTKAREWPQACVLDQRGASPPLGCRLWPNARPSRPGGSPSNDGGPG
jgi:hypothetical protein